MRTLGPRSVLPPVALTAALALALGGCRSGGDEQQKSAGSSSSSASPSPSSTVKVPDGEELTDQGTKLKFGDSARVIFESTRSKGSVLQLTVRKVREGSLQDFRGFILDDSYKRRAAYYYASVQVKNIGEGDVGGVGAPLWGVNSANTLLPAVNFTTSFSRCPSKPLPAKFGPGDTLRTCLVFLSPKKGALTSISYRPNQEYNPITWTGTISKPTTPTKKAKPKKKG